MNDICSILPFFPGYEFVNGVSTYRGEEIGEGGCVRSKPGIYYNVGLLDIMSQHPFSMLAEVLFGIKYTKRFRELVDARVSIKHQDWEELNHILDGKLLPFVEMVKRGEITSDDLATALKTAINSVYGLTSAKFANSFKDPRNEDNIVAKRGALFMINLRDEVEKRGYTVAHIKTDSIKIPNVTPEIIDFVIKYGEEYGYHFEHEATYDRMALVNDAVYIAKYNEQGVINKGGKKAGQWTATGTQFQVPYVFKSLFTKEPIEFKDLCETKSVTSAIYIDMNETLPEGSHDYQFIGKVGSFVPIKPGCGGGVLLREATGNNGEKKFVSVTGCKDWRWLESEAVERLGQKGLEMINMNYWRSLCDDAITTISKYGDFDKFVNE